MVQQHPVHPVGNFSILERNRNECQSQILGNRKHLLLPSKMIEISGGKQIKSDFFQISNFGLETNNPKDDHTHPVFALNNRCSAVAPVVVYHIDRSILHTKYEVIVIQHVPFIYFFPGGAPQVRMTRTAPQAPD